ncbi:delta-like protein C isoform X2 [Magallana gigas]|uniref:delta-like protein C isoform X2 n=1 Tax=Magallana gigas TaxID=29159 RepID=UPI00333FB380
MILYFKNNCVMMYYFTMQFATPYMMIWKRTMQLLLSFLSYIKVTSTCLIPGSYGLLCDNKCGRCAGNVDCGPLLGICFGGCQPGFFGSTCKMTCSATCGGDGSCSQLTAFCENGCQSGFTGTQCDQIITSPESDAVLVWGPIAVTSLVVTIACIVILVLRYIRKNNKTESSYERNLVFNLEEETMSYVELNQLQENIRNNSTASYLNKDQAEKNCSAIKAQQDLANFESESQDYTVPKFTREEGVPDDPSQAEPKPTDSEPHPYVYVISS